MPLDINIFATTSDRPLAVGAAVPVGVGVMRVPHTTLTLTEPLALAIQVVEVGASGLEGAVVWEGTLPPLSGIIEGASEAISNFTWDQRDSEGRQVSPGTYDIVIRRPFTFPYSIAGQRGTETIEGFGPMAISGWVYTAGVFIR